MYTDNKTHISTYKNVTASLDVKSLQHSFRYSTYAGYLQADYQYILCYLIKPKYHLLLLYLSNF